MNYGRLDAVLKRASDQASTGKGSERHADGQSFEEQPIMWIEREFRSFQLGQAVKKIHESQRLDPEAAARELLGAINYLAAKVVALDALADTVPDFRESIPPANAPCEDCHQQFGEYCLRACPFGKKADSGSKQLGNL